MKLVFASLLAGLCIAAPAHAQNDAGAMSQEARAYLSAALDSMQRVSLRRNTTRWPAVRDSAFLLATGAQTAAHTYGAINWALGRVDSHSFLQATFPRINPAMIGRVGYFRIPFHPVGSKVVLADTLQAVLRDQDAKGACGWVVDLRMNGGGNVWPMYAGVGPLFKDSIFSVTIVEGRSVPSSLYVDGKAILIEDGKRLVADSATNPHRLKNPAAPVAVLIDGGTGSSGEAVAIAFRARANTRFFGSATSGFTTANRGVRLSDGANMVVTVDGMTDRNGREYTGPIQPDEVIPMPRGFWPTSVDAVARRATAWLWTQKECATGIDPLPLGTKK